MKTILIPYLSTTPLKVIKKYEGGFGYVFILESDSGEKHALKTLKWEVVEDKDLFAREIDNLIKLPSHPHIIQISGIVREKGIPYICMPFCESSVFDLYQENKIDINTVEEIVKQVADGLFFIHEQAGMLHLDLKPQNILISEKNNYVISDFGISKVLPEPNPEGIYAEFHASGLTGTLIYMSPEHLFSKKMTDKSDIFSLGIILYELLTGRHPFIANSMNEIARNILSKKVTFNIKEKLKFSSLLKNICISCLEKSPQNRPSASDICDLFRANARKFSLPDKTFDLINNINKANSLISIGKLEEGKEILNKCIEEAPSSISARISLGEVYFKQGDIDKAKKLAEDTLKIFDWLNINEDEVKKSLNTILVNLASYYLSIDPHSSLKFARKSVIINPNDWQALGNLAEACRLLSKARNRKELLDEGMEVCQKALSIAPDDLKLRVTYGGLLLEIEDFETLSPYVVNLINEFGGDDVPLRILLIETLIATGQVEDAKQWLNPMRGYEPLEGIVATLDKEMSKRNGVKSTFDPTQVVN